MKPLGQVTIVIFDNGNVQVSNFPDNLDVAMSVFYKAELAVIKHFMKKGKKKKKEPSRIITLNNN